MEPFETREELARHHLAAFGWAMACCQRDVSLAEATLQTTYVKILDGTARFAGRSAFRTWLFGVIRRTAFEERRRAMIQRLLLVRLPAPRGEATPEEITARSEMRDRLLDALRRVSRRQREVLELVFYHDMTLDEAAAVLGLSPGSARTHYARGKERLRVLLSEKRIGNERRGTAELV